MPLWIFLMAPLLTEVQNQGKPPKKSHFFKCWSSDFFTTEGSTGDSLWPADLFSSFSHFANSPWHVDQVHMYLILACVYIGKTSTAILKLFQCQNESILNRWKWAKVATVMEKIIVPFTLLTVLFILTVGVKIFKSDRYHLWLNTQQRLCLEAKSRFSSDKLSASRCTSTSLSSYSSPVDLKKKSVRKRFFCNISHQQVLTRTQCNSCCHSLGSLVIFFVKIKTQTKNRFWCQVLCLWHSL